MGLEHTHSITEGCAPKTCRDCQQLGWGCEFHLRGRVTKDGTKERQSRCKNCQAKVDKARYDDTRSGWILAWKRQEIEFTLDEYDEMFSQQAGRCKICKELQGDRRLQVDHDHSTGTVRGLLCLSCNRLLGLAKDSKIVLLSAALYLEEAETIMVTSFSIQSSREEVF